MVSPSRQLPALLFLAVAALAPGVAFAQSDVTTLVLSPASGPDLTSVTASGMSNCGSVWVTMEYTRYDGGVAYASGTHEQAPYDAARQQYRYTVRLSVPVDARPGQATVYTQPYCSGDPGDYPDSERVTFSVTRAVPGVQVSPLRGRPGSTFVVAVSRCFGSTSRSLPVDVEWRDGARRVEAVATGRGTFEARVRVPASAAAGEGTALLPASADCPGSQLPARNHFSVLPPRRPASPSAASQSSTAAPESTSPAPSSPGAPPPRALDGAPRRAEPGRGAAPYVALVTVALAAAALGIRMRSRRRQHH